MEVSSHKHFFASLIVVALLTVSCTTPEAPAAAVPAQTATIAVMTPDAGWRLRIDRIYERDGEIWILARVERVPGPAARGLGRAEAAIPVALASKPQHVFVAGKTWAWRNDEPYEFVASLDEVVRRAGPARLLFREGR